MIRAHLLSQLRRRQAQGVKPPRRKMPRMVLPAAIAIEYAAALRPILEAAQREVEREVLPLVRRRLDDEFNLLLDRLSERFFARLSSSSIEAIARRIAGRTSDWSRAELSRQLSAGLGIELPLSDSVLGPKIEAFLAEQIALVKSVPNQYLDDVEKIVTRAVSEGKRYADVAAELSARFGLAEASSQRLARDQVNKLYNGLNQARQEDLGLTRYVWRTMNDNRTRPEHARREGKRYDWNSAPSGGHPGQAVGCRCYAEPDLSTLLEAA